MNRCLAFLCLPVLCLSACAQSKTSAGASVPPGTDDMDIPAQTARDAAAGQGIDAATGPGAMASDSGVRPATDAPASAGGADAAASVGADAGAGDAALAPVHCQNPNILFCEDFESGMIDLERWRPNANKGVATVDSTKAARGKYSLHATPIDNATDGYHLGGVTTRAWFPVAGQRLFIRAFVYIMPNGTARHYGVLLAAGTTRYHVDVIPSTAALNSPINYRLLWDHGASPDPSATYGNPWTLTPTGRWACWEWELRGTNNEVHFAIDDVEIPGLKVDSSMNWTAPPMAQLRFGLEAFHPSDPGFGVWIDEIAVSAQKIGCAL